MRSIDLNGDAGESHRTLADGSEEAFLESLTSANVACGGHAGDVASMEAMVVLCRRLGVSLGAHPSYPDRAAFGRRSLMLPPATIEDEVFRQLKTLGELARAHAVPLRHLKPHGGLYHDCAASSAVAEAVARAAARWSGDLVLVAAFGSTALEVWRASGFAVTAEAFADRVYEPDGGLRSREREGAVIVDAGVAAAQAIRIAVHGEIVTSDGSVLPIRADSICVHGDTPAAATIARRVRETLRDHVEVRAM